MIIIISISSKQSRSRNCDTSYFLFIVFSYRKDAALTNREVSVEA
nr:MAG TPA: hypothetical protein [Caudoviricetes sp.]DAQ49202.1 MAG TPA: hypothetical protein [Caudoviricetes sp.]